MSLRNTNTFGRGRQRFVHVDALRGIALVLAFLDHVKVQFVTDVHVLVPLTRFSTPCFIILFGAMIDIAYLSKRSAGTTSSALVQRMLSRAITCFLVSAVMLFAAILSGNLSIQAGSAAIFGLGLGRFNEILLVYAGLFLIVIICIAPLIRYGSRFLLLLAILGWGIWAGANHWVDAPPYWLNFITGAGQGYGPAILPGLTLMAFGMAAGEWYRGHRSGLFVVLLAVVAAGVCLLELSGGLQDAGRRFLAHRWINHPGYFAWGICGVMVLFTCVRMLPVQSRVMSGLSGIGRQSLFYYGFGNIVLNLIPATDIPPMLGGLYAIMFMLALTVLTLMGGARRNQVCGGTLRPLHQLYDNAVNGCAAMLTDVWSGTHQSLQGSLDHPKK